MKAIVLDNQCNRVAVFNNVEEAKKFRTKLQKRYKEWFGVLYGRGNGKPDMTWLSRSRKYNRNGEKYIK